MTLLRHFVTGSSLFLLLMPSVAFADLMEELVGTLFDEARIVANGRLRYEFADQDSFPNNANALTFRGRFGFETGALHDFKLLAEGDFTRDLGVDDFNSTTNGLITFPVVADPNSERLNRLQLKYEGLPDTVIVGGRQRIKLDDDRFIGNVGFRQNEQTYDAIRVTNTSIENLTLDYSYFWQVNRIFGSESPIGEGDADTHLIHASYKTPFGTAIGYAYLIDINDLVGQSNQTFGGRFEGGYDFSEDWGLVYAAEYARQSDFGSAPGEFANNFFRGMAGLRWKQFTIKGATEILAGDGTQGFITPLATLHKFNGFADLFLVTPAGGLEDIYGQISYKRAKVPVLGSLFASVWYHSFHSELTGADLGEEVDFVVSAKPFKHVEFRFKYADFFGAPTLPDTRRIFLTVNFSY
ncbi:MAG: hypothetical protein AAGF15_03525 [Pseudomonadota bacterium]